MKKPHILLLNTHFLIITILTLGVVFAVSTLNQRTSTRQFAAQPVNLNTAQKMETTNNSNKPKEPDNPANNFAWQLPEEYLGNLQINLTQNPQTTSDIQTIKLQITKAEARLIYLFLPGTSKEIKPAPSNKKTNQNVNQWETLQINDNTIGETGLANGKYSEIRIYISNAKAILKDGREEILIFPGNKLIRILRPFNIYAGQTTTITLELDTQNSIVKTNDKYILTPFISNMKINI